MDLTAAPALVRVPRKTLWHPSAHKDVIVNAVRSARALGDVMPVFSEDGYVIGLVGGSKGLNHTRFKPISHKQWCGFDSFADLVQEIGKGKFYEVFFRKDGSGVVTANRWYDLWPCGGIPMSGVYTLVPADTLRQFDATTIGTPYLPVPSGSDTLHLIGVQATTVSTTGNLQAIIYDRVAAYDGGAISTSLRSMTNTLSAQRYIGTGDPGLQIMVCCQSATGATASTLASLNYTDNEGNAAAVPVASVPDWLVSAPTPSSTVPAVVVLPHNGSAGITWGPFMPLAAGDTGVRSITDYTSGGLGNTGTISMALVKPLGVAFANGLSSQRVDFSQTMFGMERLFSGACLGAVITRASVGTTFDLVFRVAYG